MSTTARQTLVVKGTTSGTFEADEQIVQTSTGAVGKVVEYDSDRSLLYYQQERFSSFGTSATNSGFTAFSGTNLITGQTSGATLTPSSDTETVTLLNSKYTYTHHRICKSRITTRQWRYNIPRK